MGDPLGERNVLPLCGSVQTQRCSTRFVVFSHRSRLQNLPGLKWFLNLGGSWWLKQVAEHKQEIVWKWFQTQVLWHLTLWHSGCNPPKNWSESDAAGRWGPPALLFIEVDGWVGAQGIKKHLHRAVELMSFYFLECAWCVCVSHPVSKGFNHEGGSRSDITNLDQRSWVISRDMGLGQSHVPALV